jgi:hypothetical protein
MILKIIQSTLMLATVVAATAQTAETPQKEYLFKKLNIKVNTIGLYVQPTIGYGQAAGASNMLYGAGIGFILNEKLAFGMSRSKFREDFQPKMTDNTGLHMNYRMAGGFLEYTFKPEKAIHFSIFTNINRATVTIDSASASSNDNDGHRGKGSKSNYNNTSGYSQSSSFMTIQPGIRVEANLFRYAKLFAGASYVFALSPNMSYPSDAGAVAFTTKDFSGYNLQLGLKMGLFDFKIKKKQP